METRKQKHHALIRDRAAEALADLYHNATVTYPRDLRGRSDDYFQSWFESAGKFEVDYLQSGGANGPNPRATFSAPCNAGKYHSERARAYYVAKSMRAMRAEREDCGALTGWRALELVVRKAQGKSQSALWHRWFQSYFTMPKRSETKRHNARWEYISEYGKLYQYGRGGRTLAPDQLYSDHGHAKVDPAELSISACVDLIRIVESFNAYVGAWCKSVPEQWHEHCETEDAEARAAKRAAAQHKARETRERNYWACRDVVTV